MHKSDGVKWIVLTGVVAICITGNAFSSTSLVPVRINNYIVPAIFASALYQGMKVPVFIRYDKSDEIAQSKQKIADALLSLHDGEFQINQITLSDLPDRTALSSEVKNVLEGLKNKRLGKETHLRLSEDASLSLDTKSFYLELTVSEAATSALLLPRTSVLGNSSADHFSNVLNYTFGSYYNQSGGLNNASSYLTADNTSALREHHFNLNGSLYGVGTANPHGGLYRAMYERDFQGRRIALGMVDTWNLQSVASMSALNSSRIYGVSYGNKSNTQREDNTLSLVPVTVFLPAAGEVHVYRDGKLLSIQNFMMGTYEVDTSRLPFGIYNVDVQVVVNGKIVSSRTAQINKTFARDSSVTGNVSWQLFGGVLEYNETSYRKSGDVYYGKKQTWISGVAAATTQPWLSGVTLKSTLYGFDHNVASESEANLAFNDRLSLNQQVLLATDSSWQSISTLNLNVPGGYGSFWGARSFSHAGIHLPLKRSDSFIIGSTANLGKFSHWLGVFSVSRTDNRYNNNRYTNANYSQSVFSNRYISATLNTGIQRYSYDSGKEVNEKYVSASLSLPLSSWLSAGVSSENGNFLANVSVRRHFDNSAINQAGISVSKRINNNERSYASNSAAANGYMSYAAKYNSGTLSATRSSDGGTTVNFSSQGSVGFAENSLTAGQGLQNAGLMVKTGFTDNEKIIAKINGRNYSLSGKDNYISLPSYSEYQIELMNDKNSPDTVDIISSRKSKVVLYPGNIGVITPEVKQLVTVFGRIRRADGSAYINTDIANHIGKTRTDEYGEFAMDVDKRYPVITLINSDGERCEAELDLHSARGAIWIGEVTCIPLERFALRNKGNQ
ncbi:TcfC E-set like domain-containing protein [Erwinia psidii]|uniref:Fimbrial biogenesis outer membrane usher protein n=1 Tax=Erwinia psidii TaxID=69224 RepID=A0A3N6RVQ5_9GAMM|nr:TcfC E-set like domain-containing protein [Erwinia psidii]MCX8958058.1 fimbrial biogenesis outer membrane usher protein [Erwinia psidii]MCX8962459.1 fimbrial biogenesis outer membrane usher protein [Erwinia psidii]MCX8963867.1 fimbrial biogenesis outer membrane usher protein [Erwinia psidii]RQM37038.1 fimbrial biogenesis outer membrane usher protein [Erwinia psidii]